MILKQTLTAHKSDAKYQFYWFADANEIFTRPYNSKTMEEVLFKITNTDTYWQYSKLDIVSHR